MEQYSELSVFSLAESPAVGADLLRAFEELEAPFSSREALLYLNFATRNLETEGRATTLYDIEVSEEVLSFASLLGTKAFIMSDGCCVMSSKHRQLVESFARYTESHGLTSPGSIDNVLFVEDVAEVINVFSAIAQRNKEADESVDVVLYLETEQSHTLAAQAGISLEGCGEEVAREVIDRFSDKSQFRDMISSLMGEELASYPRIQIRSELTNDSFQQLEGLQAALSYYPLEEEDTFPKPVLFMQFVQGAGGNGNSIIHMNRDGSLQFIDFHGEEQLIPAGAAQLHALRDIVASQGLNTEIAPFLNLSDSYSYSVSIADRDGESCDSAILHKQLLSKADKSYKGGVLDIERGESKPHINETEQRLVHEVTKALRRFGYRGPFSIDCFRYIDSEGVEQVGVAEVNLRRTSPSFPLGVAIRDGGRRNRLARGELSLLVDDKFELDEGLTRVLQEGAMIEGRILQGAELLAYYLESNGIPMVNDAVKGNEYGVLFVTPPLPLGDVSRLSLAILAESDEEKYEIYSKLQRLAG